VEIQRVIKKLGLKIGSVSDGIIIKSSLTALNRETAGMYALGMCSLIILYFSFQSRVGLLMVLGSLFAFFWYY